MIAAMAWHHGWAVASILVVACTKADGDGSSADTSSGASTGAAPLECDDPALVWRSGAKTSYESYPAPGSDECVIYNGCEYLGQFAACNNTMPEAWVAAHDIVAVFPLHDLALHRLCLRSGTKTLVVSVVDTCETARSVFG